MGLLALSLFVVSATLAGSQTSTPTPTPAQTTCVVASTFAGPARIRPTASDGVAVNELGEIFVSELSTHEVLRILSDGSAAAWVGTGVSGFSDGQGTSARFALPSGISFGPYGDLYVSDVGNYAICGGNGRGVRDGDCTAAQFVDIFSASVYDPLLAKFGANKERLPLVDAVYAALREAGLRVWIDRDEMGRDLKAAMAAGIVRSAVVVVLASPSYAASANCLFELETAAAAGKPIVSCCVEPGFWRSWMLADGITRAVPDDHELARLARLDSFLYVDLGEASKVDWTRAPVPDAERRRLTHAPEALPRLLSHVRDALRDASGGDGGGGSAALAAPVAQVKTQAPQASNHRANAVMLASRPLH